MKKNKGFVYKIIEKRLLVTIIMFMLIIGGLFSYISIPKQHFPEVVLPIATVTVVYPGASAEDMEELVTKKIEDVAMESDGFDSCSSQTFNNVSAVMVKLDMNMTQEEVDDSFDKLRRKINDITPSLPDGVTKVSVDTEVMDTAGLILAVSGEGVSGDELAQRTDELKDRLKIIDGVKKVDVSGKQESEVSIKVDSDKLNNLGLSLAELSKVISAQNSMIPTGTIDVDNSVITVTSSGKFESIEEIKNIVIGSSDTGAISKLSDIANVEIKVPDDSSKFMYNKKDANVISLYFKSGINVVNFGDSIRDTINDFKKTLPDNIKVEEVYFQPDVVGEAVNGFVINLIEAIVLVLVVLMIGMNLRNAIVVSIAIPLIILMNFIVMKLIGIDIQFVSLAALIVVLGMMVDNAIVVSDSIQTRLDNDESGDRISAVVKGTNDVIVPVFISMLTTVSAFLSLMTLSGAYKQLISSLPIVIIVCLVSSFIVSVFVTPLMSYFFLRKSDEKKKGGSQKLTELYDRVFQLAFKNKKKAILVAVSIMIVCSLSIIFIDMQVIPKAFKDVITIEITGDNENDIKKTEDVVNQIQKILDKQPEKKYYLSGVGIGVPRYDYSILPKSQLKNVGDIFVRVDLSKSKRFKDTFEMVEYLQKEFDDKVSGGRIVVDELGIMAGTSKPIEMKIYGKDIDDLNEASDKVAELMSSIKGTKNVNMGREISTYNYYINMDTKKLNSLGLMKAEVQNEISIALIGRNISTYRQNGKEYSVILEGDIDSKEKLENFKVKSSILGNKYDLQQFSEVGINSEMSSISRLDGQRGRVVGCYATSGYSDITIQNKLEKMIEETEFPESIRFEKSGMKKDFLEVLESIGGSALVSIFLIFMILIYQFNSIKKSIMVFISVPFGATAGIAALYLTGEKLTFLALIGIASLLGCVLANAIVLIEFINNEKENGSSTEEACKSAGKKRFTPILMSTMTTVLGLIPLAFGGDALFVPMARLMMMGLLVSMIINLILVPIIYCMVDSKEKKNEDAKNNNILAKE